MIELTQKELVLLNQYYNLKYTISNTPNNTIELTLNHNKDEIETILNSMITELTNDSSFKSVFNSFHTYYLSFKDLNSNLIDKINNTIQK